ncbi:hypothetical protein QOT17_003376 [Balamuthia mandrillaris]
MTSDESHLLIFIEAVKSLVPAQLNDYQKRWLLEDPLGRLPRNLFKPHSSRIAAYITILKFTGRLRRVHNEHQHDLACPQEISAICSTLMCHALIAHWFGQPPSPDTADLDYVPRAEDAQQQQHNDPDDETVVLLGRPLNAPTRSSDGKQTEDEAPSPARNSSTSSGRTVVSRHHRRIMRFALQPFTNRRVASRYGGSNNPTEFRHDSIRLSIRRLHEQLDALRCSLRWDSKISDKVRDRLVPLYQYLGDQVLLLDELDNVHLRTDGTVDVLHLPHPLFALATWHFYTPITTQHSLPVHLERLTAKEDARDKELRRRR